MPSGWPAADHALDAVVFDFDGVIVESLDIKSRVFATLFADFPAKVAEIVALHERHAGINRMVKFEMIHRDILGVPLDDSRRTQLGRRFEDLVVEQVIACPMVAGAREVLESLHTRVPMAVASGTPDGELKHIVQRRGLEHFFTDVLGSPRGKGELIAEIIARHGWRPGRMLMVGDATADYDAARASGLAFIGRVPPGQSSPFPPGTLVIEDLKGLEKAVASLYSTSLSQI
jgi:beta-phosphoglucomutase-like phosphatase (HAD superfamily)